MLEITDLAIQHLGDIEGADNSSTPIRVAVMGSGGTNCGLGLIPDEIQETDLVFNKGDYTIIIDKNLMDFCKKITLDFSLGEPDKCSSRSRRGFLISAENSLNI